MVGSIITFLYVLNALIALVTILIKPRDVAAIWAWLLVLFALPGFGFVLYLFFGRGLTDKKKFHLRQSDLTELENFQDFKGDTLEHYDPIIQNEEHQHFVDFFSSLNQMPLTRKNAVTLLTDGQEKLTAVLKDIEAAKHSIHIEYYAFVTDNIGQQILTLLEKKAAEGVEVRLLYDAFGSHGTKTKDFKKLVENGGHVHTFITSQRALLRFRLNYHDHRKIIVVDGKIGYTGGFNIANQYVNHTKKFGYWRDTHIRIYGAAASLLQLRFLMDWNVSVPDQKKVGYHLDYFYKVDKKDQDQLYQTSIQLVSSGPNNEREQIKLSFIKLISSAKKRVWIQTPYLVPDESVIAALKIAAASGVEVKIMIPNKPDHPFIYRATQYYARQLIKENIQILVYENGFLHAKTLIMDDEICMVGSANQDIRSYRLNFESSAIIYDPAFLQQLADQFVLDEKASIPMTTETVKEMSNWLLFKQQISRLFSPIL
ncbi:MULTISPECIES: cardiolipin synthase [Enterococcus]|uniref:Cardiolipin synthase n=2 Tax=Enterococcus TaxID=1350 RepID=A0ABZ2SY95_9ENTE|nr:cardiolipin synthase [Enterococcus sp. DIV1298c]MBO0490672.1 cardiolipin synthase [Enterococcus sp. DIV1094]MBO1300066.1 cardiolipin synthase [Enterococcus sp. DIV1271a]